MCVQTPAQQYRERNLIKLKPGPVTGAINPAVLRKTAVRPLNGCQPDQCAKRRARLPGGEQRACTLHQVARPHEMITPQVLIALRFAPGNTHRSDHCALKNFVLMRQQYAPAEPIHAAAVAGVVSKVELRIHDGALPLTNVAFAL